MENLLPLILIVIFLILPVLARAGRQGGPGSGVPRGPMPPGPMPPGPRSGGQSPSRSDAEARSRERIEWPGDAPAPAARAPGQAANAAGASSASAADMLPEELWEALTGEKRRGTPARAGGVGAGARGRPAPGTIGPLAERRASASPAAAGRGSAPPVQARSAGSTDLGTAAATVAEARRATQADLIRRAADAEAARREQRASGTASLTARAPLIPPQIVTSALSATKAGTRASAPGRGAAAQRRNAGDASAAGAPGQGRKAGDAASGAARALGLDSPGGLRRAFIMREILGPPPSLEE